MPQLAAKIADKTLARKLKKVGFALGRRIDVWQEVVRLGVPRPVDNAMPEVDPQKLALCLAEIDSLTGDSPEGAGVAGVSAGRRLETGGQSAAVVGRSGDAAGCANRCWPDSRRPRFRPQQQKFVTTGPVAALRVELRRWAAEPVGAAAVLRDIETYERTSLPSDAHRLALDYQNLTLSPSEGRRQLAGRVDLHYRNANLRIAVTEELINKLIPERQIEYADVDETV